MPRLKFISHTAVSLHQLVAQYRFFLM